MFSQVARQRPWIDHARGGVRDGTVTGARAGAAHRSGRRGRASVEISRRVR
jgi:hypothetical protein